MAGSKLIVGLGNPGKKYSETRHNLGAMVVEAYAAKESLSFKKKILLGGEIATGNVGEGTVHCLLPTTYMNLSGSAVRKAIHWYRLTLEDLIVIVDDVDLPFGTMRYRERGSSGGHNGLKDIERELGTQLYARLKMGIGPLSRVPLEEFVLSPFAPEEREGLPAFVQRGVEALVGWVEGGSKEMIERINKPPEKRESGEKL